MSKGTRPGMAFGVVASVMLLTANMFACDNGSKDKPDTTASASSASGEGASKSPDGVKGDGNFLVEPPATALPADATPGGHLRVGLAHEDLAFNNLIRHPDRVPLINGLIQEPLARHHPQDPTRFVKGLADHVEISEDGRTFTITLKEGVRWPAPPHPKIDEDESLGFLKEPHEVIAEDLLFTVSLFFGPLKTAELTGFEGMESIKQLDDHTVEITWKYPSHEALVLLLSLRIQPKWLFSRDLQGKVMPDQMLLPLFERHWAHAYPIGLGPYRVKSSQAAVGIWLERNPDFHGEPAMLDSMELRDIDDEQQRIDLITAGDLDLTILPPTKLDSIKDVPRVEHAELKLFTYYFIGYNNQRAPFDDARVRRALSHSVDRPRILAEAFGSAATITDSPLLPDHPAQPEDGASVGFDLERARALLDEAGIKDTDGDGTREFERDGKKQPFSITLLSYNRPDWQKATAIWREDLAKVGVKLELKESGSPARTKEVFTRDYDAMIAGWGTGYSNRLHEIWHSSKSDPRELNYVQFKNAEADRHLQLLQTDHDHTKRLESMRAFDTIVRKEQPYTFLFIPHRIVVWNARVANVNIEKFAPQFDPRDWYIPTSERLSRKADGGEEAKAPSPPKEAADTTP